MSACLGCSQIETMPVTLHTGETVCSSCEAWRLECFERQKKADELMALPIERRREAFAIYRKAQGGVAADRLWKVMQGMEEKRAN